MSAKVLKDEGIFNLKTSLEIFFLCMIYQNMMITTDYAQFLTLFAITKKIQIKYDFLYDI